MSQSATAPPAPAPAPAAVPAAGTTPAPAMVDTPKLLNRWQLIGMTTAIVFGLLSALLQFLGWQADGRAADDTEQLVRVQEIQSSLLRADALATNAFLQGGLEDPDQRRDYDDAIDGAMMQITAAADAQPADRAALADLNVAVNDYDAAIAQARTNNRQGFPVGAEYLSGASTELRDVAVPILEALVTANDERARGSMDGQHPWLLLFVGVVALTVLWWLNREIAQAFRRRINVGIAIAAVIVLVVTVVTAVLAGARERSNDDLLAGSFRAAVDQAAARTAANDAKANESLRLIKRGSSGTYEDDWDEARSVVDELASDRAARASWKTYVERHERIVRLDDAGRWNTAVGIAIDPAEGSTEPLDTFDERIKKVVADAGDEASDELRSGRWFAFVFTLLTLLLGIVAAVFVSRGIGERRREFA